MIEHRIVADRGPASRAIDNLAGKLDAQTAALDQISAKLTEIIAMAPVLARVSNALEKIQNLERLALKQQVK